MANCPSYVNMEPSGTCPLRLHVRTRAQPAESSDPCREPGDWGLQLGLGFRVWGLRFAYLEALG